MINPIIELKVGDAYLIRQTLWDFVLGRIFTDDIKLSIQSLDELSLYIDGEKIERRPTE